MRTLGGALGALGLLCWITEPTRPAGLMLALGFASAFLIFHRPRPRPFTPRILPIAGDDDGLRPWILSLKEEPRDGIRAQD